MNQLETTLKFDVDGVGLRDQSVEENKHDEN